MTFDYPIALNLENQACLVVGGGTVALRKIEALLDCGALVTVMAPEVMPIIQKLADEDRIHLEKREYSSAQMRKFMLAIAATDDAEVNERVSRDANQENILVNVVDQPSLCNFAVPATVRRGQLIIAISTGGKSPALAKRLKKQLEAQFGPEYGELVDLMGEMREEVKKRYANQKDREAVLNRMLDLDLLEDIREGRIDEAKRKALGCI